MLMVLVHGSEVSEGTRKVSLSTSENLKVESESLPLRDPSNQHEFREQIGEEPRVEE
jgi:hypothetical protein